MRVILNILFLTLSNADILIIKRKFIKKLYILAKAVSITKWIQLISQKKFAAAALELGKKAFIVYMAYLGSKMLIYLTCEVQIFLLMAKKVTISAKYSDFLDISSKKSVAELTKCSNINKHSIDLEPGKQLLYGSIYSLKTIKLKILKIYIKTNLANGFICLFRFLAGTSILFICKLNKNISLYVNYQNLNNLIIKN